MTTPAETPQSALPSGLAERHAAAEAIARAAGAYVLDRFRNRGQVSVGRKGPHDEVSDADRAAEALIRGRIAEAFPDDRVLGEEAGFGGGEDDAVADGWLWVVDPIDGTACFVAGVPVWCVSIAVMHDGRPVIGVVEDPNAGETFSARSGGPATCNGVTIRASDATDLGAGSVGVGYSTRVKPKDTLEPLTRLLEAGGMFQRNGSGALMVCYVAAGRLIGYFEPHINAWDCLAGLVLVERAGGWQSDFLADGGLARGNRLLVGAPGVAAELRRIAGM